MAEADALEALLHRCHRSELEAFARGVGVNPMGLGLGDLARVTARTFRQRAGHVLTNLVLRKGEGPSYPDILRGLTEVSGASASPEALELILLRQHAASVWDTLAPPERAALWEELGLSDLPMPTTSGAALEAAQGRLGRRFGYALATAQRLVASPWGTVALLGLTLHPAGCLLRLLFLPFFPLWALLFLRPSSEWVTARVREIAALRQQVRHRLTIGVVGSPSTGKDAAIKVLFGIDTGNVSPIAGSTKEVAIQRLGAASLFVVNTPGMGDVVERVTEEARQVLDHIDLYLYLVNAEGGVQAREKADYERCVATGKPVLAIVNKIDVLRPRDKDRYLADARAKLGAPEANFLAVAFDPLPQLSPRPLHVEAVHAWIAAQLDALGKDPEELPPLQLPPLLPPPPLDLTPAPTPEEVPS